MLAFTQTAPMQHFVHERTKFVSYVKQVCRNYLELRVSQADSWGRKGLPAREAMLSSRYAKMVAKHGLHL